MTEKNIFAYKPFLSFFCQILIYFLCEAPTFLKNWLEAQPPAKKGGHAHYGNMVPSSIKLLVPIFDFPRNVRSRFCQAYQGNWHNLVFKISKSENYRKQILH